MGHQENKMIRRERNCLRPALAAKKLCCRGLIFAAFLFIVFVCNGRTTSAEDRWLDETQVRQAMRQEAFRLLARKISAVRSSAAEGFDYHIEQAYEKIKNRLPADTLSASELEAWLQQFLQFQKATGNETELQTLIENFIRGMSLEIINTLQFECEQVEDLIVQVAKLTREIEKASPLDPDSLDRTLRQYGFSRKMSAVIRNIDHNWQIPAADADNFSVFSILKKNMTGQRADKDQRLVFDLGERYQSRYPFLSRFLENYRRLAKAFRTAAQDINAIIAANPAEPGKGLR